MMKLRISGKSFGAIAAVKGLSAKVSAMTISDELVCRNGSTAAGTGTVSDIMRPSIRAWPPVPLPSRTLVAQARKTMRAGSERKMLEKIPSAG